MQKTALDRWYGYMKSHDKSSLWNLLHPDAVFESPVVHTPQREAINLLHRLMGEQLAKG